MQAVTQVNARRGPETNNVEADLTVRWGRPMLPRKSATNALCNSTGVETTACIEGTHMKHGKPMTTAAPAATDNPRGPGPVASAAERLVVALKPSNVGGAKGPHFGRVGGRDNGIAIGFGLATQKEPERPGSDSTVRRRLRRWRGRGPAVKLVGEPDAGNPPVRFDEREVETEHGMRLLRHRPGKPRNRICRSLTHRATSRLYPFRPR